MMTNRTLRVVLLACLLVVASRDAKAEPAFQPRTENERLLLQMLKNQQQEIDTLKSEVKRLHEKSAGPTAAGMAPGKDTTTESATTTNPSAGHGNAASVEAVDKKVDELSKVMQARVSQVESRTQDGKVSFTGPGPRLESPSGDYSVQLVGTIQADAAGYQQDDRGPAAGKLHGGTNIRRLHIGVQGTTFKDFQYALVYDASGTGNVTSGVRDALVAYTGFRPFTLTLGQQKPNVGLEPNFSDRSNASTFLEPGLSATLITATGTRAIGARVSAGSDHYSASLGFFGDDITNENISSPLTEGWGPAGRLTVAPINDAGKLLHLGASGYWRKAARASGGSATNPNFQLRYRAQPEVTVDSTRLVDTGAMLLGESVGLFASEGAAMYGPFSAQGEWAFSRVDQQQGRPTLQFDGGYAAASWILTGESRVYDGRTGVFTRFSPKQNFSRSGPGWGALELALRWSYVDLNSDPDDWESDTSLGGVRGGRMTDYTVGLNWYLNPWLRLMFNYVHTNADGFTVPATTGPGVDKGSEADIYAVRVHQEW